MLKNATVKTKLIGLALILLLFLLTTAGLAIYTMYQLSGVVTSLDNAVGVSVSGAQLAQRILEVRSLVFVHVMSTDPAQKSQIGRQIQEADARVIAKFDELEKTAPAYRQSLAELRRLWDSYREARDNMTLTASRAGDTAGAVQAATGEVGRRYAALQDAVRSFHEQVDARTDELAGRADAAMRQGLYSVIGFGAVGGAVAVGASILILRDVLGLAQRLRAVVEQVSRASEQSLEMSEEIASAAGNVATAIQGVARGSAEQAERVTVTGNALEQLMQTIDAVARGAQDQAKRVQRVADLTQAIAEENGRVAEAARTGLKAAETNVSQAVAGQETVRAAIQGMRTVREEVNSAAQRVDEMGRWSERIGSIVKAIEDITEQTNLLALNAAIEAARAGDAGKGFAVVAEEVRKLAERAAASTQEIAGLIHSLQEAVGEAVAAMENGARSVEKLTSDAAQVEQVLDAIVGASRQVESVSQQILMLAESVARSESKLQSTMEETAAIVEETGASAAEMATAAAQIREAVQQVNAVTEQNAAAAEEVSAAAEEITAQIDELAAAARSLREVSGELDGLAARFAGAKNGAHPTVGWSHLTSATAAPAAGSFRGNGHLTRSPDHVRRDGRLAAVNHQARPQEPGR